MDDDADVRRTTPEPGTRAETLDRDERPAPAREPGSDALLLRGLILDVLRKR